MSEITKHSIEDKIRRDQFQFLYQNSVIGILSSLICYILLFYNFYGIYSSQVLIVWLAAGIIVTLFRFISHIFNRHKQILDYRFHLFFLVVRLCATAILFGIAGSVLMPSHEHIINQMIALVIIAGVASGANQSLQSIYLISLSYTTLALFPVIIWAFLQVQELYILLGIGVFTFWFFLQIAAWRGYKTLFNNFNLTNSNKELVKQLSETNKGLQLSNAHLKASEERFRSLIQNSPIATGIITLQPFGHFCKVNDAMCEFFGYTEQELLQLCFQELTYPDDLPKEIELFKKLINNETSYFQMDKRHIHKDGHVIWTLLTVTLIKSYPGKSEQAIGQLQDISARKRNEEEILKLNNLLKDQSIHDPLTGLYNRRYLDEALNSDLKHVIRTRGILSVAMLDLDFFKRFNDQFGHEAGDVVLKSVGNILLHAFRGNDIACRFGGEEFVVVLMDADLKNAIRRLEIIRENIKSTPVFYHGKQLPPVTVSIGVALAPQQGITVNEIISAADSALYLAKQSGRDKIEILQ